MERVTDWTDLWRQLVEATSRAHATAEGPAAAGDDPWRARARDFAARVRRKWARPDLIRGFVASQVDAGTTVLDIGAGTGSWSVLLAKRARKVTAVEPSAAMLDVLREHVATEEVDNVEIVEGFWPEVAVEAHDVVFCSHSMYGSTDLPAFVNRMVEVTRRSCYLLMRVPTADGVMAEAARRVWGQPYDSPSFPVAYNVLLQMGLCPNVLVDPTFWRPWTSPGLEAALMEVKRRLGIPESSDHDEYLTALLERRLVWEEGQYVWPGGVYSALAYWDVGS